MQTPSTRMKCCPPPATEILSRIDKRGRGSARVQKVFLDRFVNLSTHDRALLSTQLNSYNPRLPQSQCEQGRLPKLQSLTTVTPPSIVLSNGPPSNANTLRGLADHAIQGTLALLLSQPCTMKCGSAPTTMLVRAPSPTDTVASNPDIASVRRIILG